MSKPDLAFVLFRGFIIRQCLGSGALLTEELILSFWDDPKCERDSWAALAKEVELFFQKGELSEIPKKINGEGITKVN